MFADDGAIRFRDREDAGDLLAQQLLSYRDLSGVLVLGIPRGGVPVAARVAMALHAPLDILIVRKLGVPGYEELAKGRSPRRVLRSSTRRWCASSASPPRSSTRSPRVSGSS